jgi:hypothetical protein
MTFEQRVLNPVEIEEQIEEVRKRIHKGVKVVGDARKALFTAKGNYDRAYAHAYLDYDGPAHEKRYGAELATEAQRDAMEIAELAYRRALDLSEALRDDLRALQSIGASIRSMYQTEGRMT